MPAAITILTIAAAFLIVVLSYIWSLVDARWFRGAATAILGVTILLLVSRALGGARPVPYGLTLALSFFMAAIMTMNGIVRLLLRVIEARR